MTICTAICIGAGARRGGDPLSTAVTLDLTITASLLYFWVAGGFSGKSQHRQFATRGAAALRVFVTGLLLSGLLLHNRPHAFLSGIRTWIFPLVEGALIFFLVRKFYAARRSFAKVGEKDLLSYTRSLLTTVMGNDRIGHILASEIAVFYYACSGYVRFRKKKKVFDQPPFFTSYRKNGILLVIGVLLGCFLVETMGLHLVAGLLSKKLAWCLTALSAYSALQLYAHGRAIRARPIQIDGRTILLRNGLMADACINVDIVEEIGICRKASPAEKAVQLALFKSLEGYNVRIRLREQVVVTGLFGIRRQATTIVFFVDEPDRFLDAARIAGCVVV